MITLYENLRSIVYAPFYLADKRQFWSNQGLHVNIKLSPDPVETAEGLLEGRADISWGGPMRVMLHHERDRNCPLVAFGQIVARDPFILIGREPKINFQFKDLKGMRLAVAHEVPTPWMTLQDDLKRAGVDPDSLEIASNAPMHTNLDRLINGEIDVVQVLEPYASAAVSAGHAHVWHRFASRGDIGYTSFYTTKHYIAKHPQTCAKLIEGIKLALLAIANEPASAIATELADLFPDVTHSVLTNAIAGYQASGLWTKNVDLSPTAFVRLKGALLSGGLISRDIPFDHVIYQLET